MPSLSTASRPSGVKRSVSTPHRSGSMITWRSWTRSPKLCRLKPSHLGWETVKAGSFSPNFSRHGVLVNRWCPGWVFPRPCLLPETILIASELFRIHPIWITEIKAHTDANIPWKCLFKAKWWEDKIAIREQASEGRFTGVPVDCLGLHWKGFKGRSVVTRGINRMVLYFGWQVRGT